VRNRLALLLVLAPLLAGAGPAAAQSAPPEPAAPAVPVFRAEPPSDPAAGARAALALARRSLAARDAAAAEPRFQKALELAQQASDVSATAQAAEGLFLSGVQLKRPDTVLAGELDIARSAYAVQADGPALGAVDERLRRYRPQQTVLAKAPTAPPAPKPAAPPAPRPTPTPAPAPEPKGWDWNEPSHEFGNRFGLEFVMVSPSGTPALGKQYGGLLRARINNTPNFNTYWAIGGTQGGFMYELGFELAQTIDLAVAYLTFGLGGGIDGLTGRSDESYGLPLAGVFPFRVQLMLGELGFFNLYGEAKVAWVTGERGTAVGIKDLEKFHVHEATLEFGLRFSSGLDLAVRRRMLGSANFDTVALRFSWL
jgi:hypothetical protein